MKLKLFIASILVLLTLVAYQKYSEYSALKSVDSYETCRSLKSSDYTSTTPSFCTTKLGITYTEPTPIPTPQSLPTPIINGWKKYTDRSTSQRNFTFEYPDFMPEPTIYWPNESVLRFISIYAWQVDDMNVGNYSHEIDLRITGPYSETKGRELVGWIKEQGWPSIEGEVKEMAGINRVIYRKLGDSQIVESTFRESGMKYPRSWILYFRNKNGIYRIDLDISGTEEELTKYQEIFFHILSTLKFTN